MKILKSQLFRFIFYLACIVAVFNLTRSIISVINKRDVVRQTEEMRLEAQRENDELRRKLAESQTAEFIERQARNKLGLVKEGETVVIIEKPEAGANQLGVALETNWRLWWRLFF